MVEKFDCMVCGKTFGSQEVLQMHAQAKHSKPETKKPQALISSKSARIGRFEQHASH